MRFYSSTREWPGVFFLCRSKRSRLLRAKELTMRVWLLCWRVWRVDRRLQDNSLCSLSLHGSEGRSSKVLVADASSAPVGSSATIWTVSADETDVEVVMSLSGATRALVLFCNAVGVNPALSWPKILLARPVSPLPCHRNHFFIVCSTRKFILHVPVCVCVCVSVCVRERRKIECVCVCVCVCSSIGADTENQNFLFTDWRGGWVGPRKY